MSILARCYVTGNPEMFVFCHQGKQLTPSGGHAVSRRWGLVCFVWVRALTGCCGMQESVPVGCSPGSACGEAPDAASAVLAAPNQQTFANPGGTMTTEISAVPLRVKRGDEWRAIDTPRWPAPMAWSSRGRCWAMRCCRAVGRAGP